MSTNLRPDASAARARRIGICGGGVAGLTLAARLARLGFAVTVLEARDEAAIAGEGVFLTLAPNGMNGLRAIDLDGEVAAHGIATTAIEILDERGRRLALIDQSDHAAAFGAPSVTIRRGLLASLLLTQARAEGATVRLGERVAGVTDDTDGVVVATEDGEALRFDLLAACDGLRSRVRESRVPGVPRAALHRPDRHRRLRRCAGRSAHRRHHAHDLRARGVLRLHQGGAAAGVLVQLLSGRRGARAHARGLRRAVARAAPGGPAGQPRHSGRASGASTATIRSSTCPSSRSGTGAGVVLVGDAAHAVGPHAGQGASMAIEDAVVLAACLEAEPTRPPRSHASNACAEAASARSSG